MRSRRRVLIASLVFSAALVFLSLVASGSQAAKPAEALQEAGQSGPTVQGGWSSGWVSVDPGYILNLSHALGGTILDYSVQLWFRDTDVGGYGINTLGYGGMECGGSRYGASWVQLTDADVTLYRFANDLFADQFRIWIWFSEETPSWCSDWTAITAGTSHEFEHNVGGNVEDYVVGLWFRGDAAYGVNQHFYGGYEDEAGPNFYGAWWRNLTDTHITVERAANDPNVSSEVRVCITEPDPADWDSGWQALTPDQTKQLAHGLGGDVSRYVVRTEFKDADPTGIGINQRDVGGNCIGTQDVGANWQNLTASNISIWRHEDDVQTDWVRVRIWKRTATVYLPLVLRNY